MEDAKRTEAGRRSFEILTSILEEHDDLYLSLACTSRLLAKGATAVVDEVASVVESWKEKSPEEMLDLVDLLPPNPFVALAKTEPAVAFAKVEHQMSISALITAHAFFEKTVKDLLTLTILCDRANWLAQIDGKNVTYGDLATKGAEICGNELIEKELSKLCLSGMPAMLSRLLGFCKGNVTTKSHFQNYRLDMDRIRTLDQLRHDYAHRRTKKAYTIIQADKDLRYLTTTAIHFVTCLMEAFDLKGQHRPKSANV